MPTPSAAQAATNHNWVSSAVAIAPFLLKPEVDPKFYQRYGDQNLTGMMSELGGMNPISALQYTHYEEDWIHEIVKVSAQGGGAGAATVTLTVQAGYQYTYPGSAQAPYIIANNTTTHPVRANQVVQFPNGVQAITSNITSTTFDVTPLITADSIPATTTATEIPIVGNAFDEGSDQPLGLDSRPIQYQNNLQLFKEDNTSTGTEMAEQIWIKIEGKDGKTGWLWYYKTQLDAYKRMKNLREVSMLVGKKMTNATAAALYPTTTTTEGLIPFINNYGNTTNYSLVNGITRADFENMIVTQLDKNRGARENSMWLGIALAGGIDRFIGAEMKNGGISYGAFGGAAKKYIDFGFDSFQLMGYTFHKKTYDVFNYPKMLGAAGQGYVNLGLVIPMDKTIESVGPEKKKVEVPAIRMNYLSQEKAGGSYSREFEEWMTGAANGIYTGTTDQVRYSCRSHWGFEGFGANRFVQMVGI